MRLIDADELIPLIKMGEMNTYSELGEGRNGGIAFAIERINQMPTIEERKKGEVDKTTKQFMENCRLLCVWKNICRKWELLPQLRSRYERITGVSDIKMGNGKGMFVPEVTVEMFRNAPLEAVEELMAEGEVFDIDLKETIHREKEQAYMKGYEDGRERLIKLIQSAVEDGEDCARLIELAERI